MRARSLAGGELDAGFEASVGLGEVAVGVYAGGGVVAWDAVGAGEVLFLCSDDEVAVFCWALTGRLV